MDYWSNENISNKVELHLIFLMTQILPITLQIDHCQMFMMFIPFSVDHGHCYLKYTDCEVRKIFRDVGFYGKEEISATKQNKGMTLVHG